MIQRLLIANRGEIACRIIKTAQQIGIKTVAVYSEADQHARHVALADEAYCIGAAPASESYLKGQAIIEVALNQACDAIHPGYGFLSENAEFARACQEAKLIFVGPSPDTIELMGSKHLSKQKLAQTGVPLVPGYQGDVQDEIALLDYAKNIGFPVLIKASAGGGGKGMRIVESESSFLSELHSAIREAKSAFDDERVLLEKYLDNPRHIEVQVFADQHGNILHLFERDCSIQRRYQKIIEEAPAVALEEDLRQKIGQAAIEVAQAVNYCGAGTVEFLLDQSGAFYFMEMNTRLQVEHPVTEMITGIDLVAWQLSVAAGGALPIKQDELSKQGHAIEARVYAEDPSHHFKPCTGRLWHLSLPPETEHLRIDHGLQSEDEISVYYDPLLMKVISWAPTRSKAIEQLSKALNQITLLGVSHNIGFLDKILHHPAFQKGHLSTHFVQIYQDTLDTQTHQIFTLALCMAAVGVLNRYTNDVFQDPNSPWNNRNGWTLNQANNTQTLIIAHNHNEFELHIHFLDEGCLAIEIAGELYDICYGDLRNQTVTINNTRYKFQAFEQDGRHIICLNGFVYSFEISPAAHFGSLNEANTHQVEAPMSANITQVLCQSGDTVKKGQLLMTLEAMKMEHKIIAPQDGTIDSIHFSVDDIVHEGDRLVTFK